jgi:hydroxymethylbilane synthase
LVSKNKVPLAQLPKGAKVGTSSLRRATQLKKIRPDIETCNIRGNVDTRIRKIEQGEMDGMILAYAGIKRLELEKAVTEIFDFAQFLPQAGQGIIALEILDSNSELDQMLQKLNHPPSFIQLMAERAFLATLHGGCQVPVGISSKLERGQLNLKGGIFSVDGQKRVEASISGPEKQNKQLGKRLAEELLSHGGKEILEKIKHAK